jgi:hypothetical protein
MATSELGLHIVLYFEKNHKQHSEVKKKILKSVENPQAKLFVLATQI